MADLVKTNGVTNGSATYTSNVGASSQTIVVTKDERMGIIVNNAGASPITATVVKGNGIKSVEGDLTVNVANGAIALIGPLESARFKDVSTGKITLNLSATTSVTVGVVQL